MVYSLTIPEILHESPFSLFTVQCEKKKLQAKKANKKRSIMRFNFPTRPADASIPPCCCRIPMYKSPRLTCEYNRMGVRRAFFVVSEQIVATLLLLCFGG